MAKRFQFEITDKATANAVVRQLHRHSAEIGVSVRQILIRDRNSQEILGVGILGRPVSQILDDGLTLEVSRTATDGTPHACSAILGALAREAQSIRLRGHTAYRLTTYTRISETGASLRAAGWRLDIQHHSRFVRHGLGVKRTIVPIEPKSWAHKSRTRPARPLGEPRLRWIKLLPTAHNDDAAFEMGRAAASARAKISANPFSFPVLRNDGVSQVDFIGADLWEIWREGYRMIASP
ncbi:XF1762 family protein [Microvirga sp. Mcv34]|uniref:XF1762 family protein n=1 Tax=Microvirga sp. Mcv34 TaxID=2926016 RepID=UPI003967411F